MTRPDTKTRPALVALEDADRDRDLLERARSFAVGTDTVLVVVTLATPEEYKEVERTLDHIGRTERTSYDEGAVLEGISGDIEDVAADTLGTAVSYDCRTVVADPDDQATAVVDIVNQTGCDHIFLPGIRRSPARKALFGDRAQQVILEFTGYVTVAMN
jgi:nucleotide-binding universal stress UspA family protein